MITNFSGMSSEFKILNEEELQFKKYCETIYFGLKNVCNDLNEALETFEIDKVYLDKLKTTKEKISNKYDELLNRYSGVAVDKKLPKKEIPTTKEIETLKAELNKLIQLITNNVLSAEQQDELNVNKFHCTNCDWTGVATMVGAPNKCGNCGSKDYLERAVIMTKKGKVKNPVFIKYNPDTNKRKESLGELEIKEKIDKLSLEIEKRMSNSQIKPIKEEKQMSDNKMFVVKCTGAHCGFQFDTTHSPTNQMNAIRYSHCQRCNHQTTYTEKN